MKKGTKIALIVAAVMIVVGATLCNIARGRGEGFSELFRNGGVSISSGTVNLGVEQKGYTVCTTGEASFSADEVRALELNWTSGSVTAEPYDGKELMLRETSSRTLSEDECLRWKLEGGRLSVLICANGVRNLPEKDLAVLVPRGWVGEKAEIDVSSAEVTLRGLTFRGALSVGASSGGVSVIECACASLDVESSSGDQRVEATAVSGAVDLESTSGRVSMSGCACTSLDVESSSGDQRVEATAVSGEADLESTSGAKTLSGLAAGELALSASSGDTRFEGSARSLKAHSSSGKVELSFTESPGAVEVETSSGNVTLSFPKGTAIALDYDTSSGSVSLEGQISSVGIPVEVETSSGDIAIRER